MIRIVGKFIIFASQAGIVLLSLITLGLLFLVFKEEGIAGIWSTVTVDVLDVFRKFLLILVIFFVITGAINHLQKRHPREFLEIVSGKYGEVSMVLLSMAMPGPAGGKQLQDAWSVPGANKAILVLCLIAMMGASMNMFIFRSVIIGPTLTLIWVGVMGCVLFQIWFIGKIWTWCA